jgi:hypothetical protein
MTTSPLTVGGMDAISLRSRVRYTSPMPPAQSGPTTSYGPMRVPAESTAGRLSGQNENDSNDPNEPNDSNDYFGSRSGISATA